MTAFGKKIMNKLPNRNDEAGNRYFKTVVYLSLVLIVLMIITAVVTFYLTFDGGEHTMVPDLQGLELENALIELQDKSLIPFIRQRSSTNQADKGTILSQDPNAGSEVRVESRVVLIVSKGATIEKLSNYVGRNLDDVENMLKSLVSIYGPLLRINKPVLRVFHESAAGTILEQQPLPGLELTSLTDLVFVVSKGPEGQTVTVRDYEGLRFTRVLGLVIDREIPFVFTSRESGSNQTAGTVISQSPAPESEVPAGTLLQFVMSEPDDIPEGYLFGILERNLPNYPVAIALKVEAVSIKGERKELVSMKHNGGLLTIPYMEEDGTVLIVYIEDQEVFRYSIRSLSTD